MHLLFYLVRVTGLEPEATRCKQRWLCGNAPTRSPLARQPLGMGNKRPQVHAVIWKIKKKFSKENFFFMVRVTGLEPAAS